MIDRLIQYDKALMLYLNGMHNAFFDSIMWAISGRMIWIPFYLLLTAYLAWLYRKHAVWPILLAILAVSISDFTSVHLFKEVFHRLRPCHDPEIGHLVHIVGNYCNGLYGFVSSHASNTFALASILSLVVRKKWFTLLMFSWAGIVSYSRIYLGVHFPGDVICGALWGTAVSLLLYRLLRSIPSFKARSGI